jgi:predicted RNA methylase
MARPEAHKKLGFYPAPPLAVAGICQHLVTSTGNAARTRILDPCAGEGLALIQIAQHLGVPQENLYAIELDVGRSATLQENLPDGHVLGPNSFQLTDITPGSMSLIYLNPPFQDELGGWSGGGRRREEHAFFERAVRFLAPGGVMVLVLPMNALAGNRDFVEAVDSRLESVAAYRFPDEVRQYREIVVIGKLRKTQLAANSDAIEREGRLHQMQWRYSYSSYDPGRLPRLGDVQPVAYNHNGDPLNDREEDVRVYTIPPSLLKPRFEKMGYTDDELLAVLAESPLNKLLTVAEEPGDKRPPLPLNRGHNGMLLASGELDGPVYVFHPETGEELVHLRHVVRGVPTKDEFYNEDASEVEIDHDKGKVRIKDVHSERVKMTVRNVDRHGTIRSVTDDDPTALLDEDEPAIPAVEWGEAQAADPGQPSPTPPEPARPVLSLEHSR